VARGAGVYSPQLAGRKKKKMGNQLLAHLRGLFAAIQASNDF